MGVKWDGYAVATQYSPRAMSLANLDKYLVDISNDTLEFFYANASRYIAELGRSYYSRSSDTVGYFRQWLSIISTDLPDNSYNYFFYPFDMSTKGLVTMTDLAKYFGKDTGNDKYKIFTLSAFSYTSDGMNTWAVHRLKYNRSFGLFTGDNSLLVTGNVYQARFREDIIDQSDIELLLYGKLPVNFAYDLYAQGSTDKYNMIGASLYSIDSCWLQSIGNKIPNRVSLQTWTFANQSWRRANKYADYNHSVNMWTPAESMRKLYIKPWTVIQIRVQNDLNKWLYQK